MKKLLIFIFLIGTTSYTGRAQKEASKLAIVFIGNSITQGKGGPEGSPPPTHAVHYLKQKRGLSDLPYINVGRSGSTTVDWLPETKKFFSLALNAADSLSKLPGYGLVFSLKLGTNDSAMKGPNGAPVSGTTYRQNITKIIDTLLQRYAGSEVILHHPIWYSTNTYNTSMYLEEGLERLNSYIPILDELVLSYRDRFPGRVHLGDTKAYKYFKKNPQYFKNEQGQQGIFHLHPNEAGTKVLGEFWGKAIHRRIR
ncbi:GDSL-type esterase/lipase family protein [Dyadobacter tibetensis]|uniref:GDSL-type esterase/lipase family protein n=1 Tax=Dyadobacter tibetensis TaxID=1211851 RepID=UPI00046FB204|nr:GDSL-type esterase/lipase family protein [Dyadobacter tibetensis]